MNPTDPGADDFDHNEGQQFYYRALTALNESKVPFLLGGAYALERYTGIARDTKDLDLFVRPEDCRRALTALSDNGCQTELTFPHWLGKAYCGEYFADIIFSSGNAVAKVDDEWFRHAIDDEMLGVPVKLCPVEETIWSKAFVMERERYDGADIAHLLLARADKMDWRRLLSRFGRHWRVLFSHIVLFGFVYPSKRSQIPEWVVGELVGNLNAEISAPAPTEPVCQGTLLSREQYLIDIEQWGYKDPRLIPGGTMTPAETDLWTEAIDHQKKN
ncbi:MAG TPA: hypothetical protein VGL70_06400 [Candidatus Binatia bacterium]|jgi:hypothetical protein